MKYLSKIKISGAITILTTIILFTLTTLIIIFAADFSIMQDKITANINRSNQAFSAADAGLEYAINYLQQNSTTILANPVSGFIPAYSDSNTANVVLANSSKYTFTYSNPIANNYNLILITSTGTSADGSATRVLKQLVQFGSMDETIPTVPLTSKGTTSLAGNTEVINRTTNSTVIAGSSVSMSGSSDTRLNSGVSSTPGNIKSDISQNNSTLANMSDSDFFATYFGVSSTIVKNNIGHYYSNTSSTDYSSTLNNMTGTSIWIDQASGTQASLSGNITIGSATNPVLMIVNGDLRMTGTVVIYGLIYVIGTTTTDVLGHVTINGGLVSAGNVTMTGSTTLNFDPTTLSNMQHQASMQYYAKVPGSWKDF